ncbi:MAG: hypothetical protein V4505_19395 [Pseudomonadota bacterium]
MDVYCVIGVRFEGRYPAEFFMGIADSVSGRWSQPPVHVFAADVVECLEGGFTVTTSFLTDGQFVAGPHLRVVEPEPGVKTVDVVGEPVVRRTLRDLPPM